MSTLHEGPQYRTWISQAGVIARLELRRVFFSRRSFWVYLLALFPAIILAGHALESKWRIARWSASGTASATVLDGLPMGITDTEVLRIAGTPINDHSYKPHPRRVRRGEETVDVEEQQDLRVRRYMMYFDGKRRVNLNFRDGQLVDRNDRTVLNFEEDRKVYAGMFQYFYLRLAIFFGCLGIFINLFRGEMLDKSLHFWFLAPVRRDVLLVGKYCAGLIAAVAIFSGSALVSFAALLSPHDPAEVRSFMTAVGAGHAFWYAAAAALACVGYGSIFLAAGLLLRNPIIPAVIMLLWESINGFLPDVLQKLSVLHYLQSICPVPAPIPSDVPAVMRLFLAPAAPSSGWLAIFGLLSLTALVLFAATRAVRRLEINYGTE